MVTVDVDACGAVAECVVSISASLTSASATSSETGRLVVSSYPTGRRALRVYSKEYEVESGSSVDAQLFRLAANTQNTVEVFMRADGVVSQIYATHLDISATGCEVFDTGGMVSATGNATWEMLLFPFVDDATDSFR